jgi:hypothetical protein
MKRHGRLHEQQPLLTANTDIETQKRPTDLCFSDGNSSKTAETETVGTVPSLAELLSGASITGDGQQSVLLPNSAFTAENSVSRQQSAAVIICYADLKTSEVHVN